MRRSVLLALVVAMALPATAQAERFATVETFSGDLHVLGDGVAWSQIRCLRDCVAFPVERENLSRFMLKGATDGRPDELARARLSHFPGGSNSTLETIRYAASTEYLARLFQAERNTGDVLSQETVLSAGPLRGPLSELVTCGVHNLPAAIDGDRLAYDESVCSAGSTNIVVRSLAGGGTATVPVQGRFVMGLALAGDFLAVAARDPQEDPQAGPPTGAITVWNWTTGEKLSEALLGPGVVLPLVEVTGTGTAAFLSAGPTCEDGRLSLLDPGASSLREVATGVCASMSWTGTQMSMSWNGSEIVVRRSAELVAIAPDGGERSLVEHGAVTLSDFAEDGARLAYALPTCGGDTTIERIALDSSADDVGTAGCQFTIPRQRLEMNARKRVRLRLNCKHGCAGTARFRGFGVKFFEQDARRGSIALRVPKRLARRVLRRGAVRRSVVVETADRAGRPRAKRRSVRIVRR